MIKATDSATLLGSPLTTGMAMTQCLAARCADLSRAVGRLKLVPASYALVLLKNSLSAPKLPHTLRSACCLDHEFLSKFDDKLRSAICSIYNVTLTNDQWLQASLPMRNGGLGIRRTCVVADAIFDSSLLTRVNNGTQPPVDSEIHTQRTWDKVIVDAEFSDLLSRYSEPYHRARLLAAAAPHSGDWLHTAYQCLWPTP